MKINWQTRKISEVCDIGAGNSAPQKKEFFIGGKYPFFRTSDIGQIHIGIISESSDYLNEKGIKGLRLFSKGTILLPKSGASTFLNHRVVLGVDGYISSHLATIKTDENILNNNYLFYFLQEIKAQDLIQDHKYPSLNLPVIGNIKISYPPVSEQHRIVKILDETFEKIEKAKENAEKNLKNSKELFESYLNNIFVNPENNWEQKTLGELSDVITKGTTPTTLGFKFINKGINFVKIESITTDGEFIPSKFAAITLDCHEYLKRSQLQDGDILYSIAGALGRTAFVTKNILPANTNQAIAIVRLKTNLNVYPEFVLRCLHPSLMLTQISKYRGGVAQQNLSLEQLRGFMINLPPIKDQNRIVKEIDAVFIKTKKLEVIYRQKLADLEELKKTILKKAFNGEL